MSVLPTPSGDADLEVETLVIGAGCAGLVAALAAHEAGQDVLVLERDAVPSGSTALSAGLIPAAGTPQQKASGITDTPELFASDIMKKACGEPDPNLVKALTEGSAEVIAWLRESHDLPFTLVDDFDYPGHTHRRMHGLPSRSGEALINALREACEASDILIATERTVQTLYADGDVITGVLATLPNCSEEHIACGRLILACNGFGGNTEMVRDLTPAIADALYFGHEGNQGDAIAWGKALGARMADLGSYQGHGNVAHPHGILVTWAVITQGGFQVNADGERFWDESQGYSEAARRVLGQPGGIAYAIFDGSIADIARQFKDFQDAEAQGAVKRVESVEALAQTLGLDADALQTSFDSAAGTDAFGRTFDSSLALAPPYCAVKVTGALFHTQGGLKVDGDARVLRIDGSPFPNLFATGGAAGGVSGSADSGYLSGNGLLSAAVLGYRAGRFKLTTGEHFHA
ncbi:MAG: FAD-dependent oxidoreductase [Rhizobiales bacterium]|nr:FAD-dependent oxidoreductase [Hyphomicrobiales bacterium]MBO6698853.1 FAD-dependent oxidoreductase [Hyphomicrobiales bacterium]MBO6734894.1 FAD-dependent oxidoreductase [Hyphomicrobiales bacterium]MBO6911300.1 FAD-dependent oxidoreductase [Hyphomicrobiales bacterium]MBO6956202.1 FAD-dependent oxidoreductase [Hyphomicrobiales bacterium]